METTFKGYISKKRGNETKNWRQTKTALKTKGKHIIKKTGWEKITDKSKSDVKVYFSLCSRKKVSRKNPPQSKKKTKNARRKWVRGKNTVIKMVVEERRMHSAITGKGKAAKLNFLKSGEKKKREAIKKGNARLERYDRKEDAEEATKKCSYLAGYWLPYTNKTTGYKVSHPPACQEAFL